MLPALLLIVPPVAALFLLIVVLVFAFPPSRYNARAQHGRSTGEDKGKNATSVQIVVLGDIGRSPRMQYHAMSIAKHKGSVQIIGYCDSEPNSDLLSNPNITIVPLSSHPKGWQTSSRLLFLLFAPLKVIFQVCSLWIALGYRSQASEWMLVQNPPSIPTLLIAKIISHRRGTRLVIDWHNFGYSLLALKLGPSHPLVKISRWCERALSRGADAHFCVTKAMARVLKSDFYCDSPILVLHDRPALYFQPIPTQERHDRLTAVLRDNHMSIPVEFTDFRILVSSTSWTPDEDFSLLLEALCIHSARIRFSGYPALFVIITGQGPQQAYYHSRIKALEEAGKVYNVKIQTAWLSIEDYATLLACADLGVSLHTSSSGVDLPMKVVDMFGAGLPVVGWDQFEAWPELVSEGVNGMGFASAKGLAARLAELFGPNDSRLQTLKAGAIRESKSRWDDEWDPVAGRLFGLMRKSGHENSR